MNIDKESKELQDLYLNDAFFHYCVKGGLDTEAIIIGMAKRNKELSDELMILKIKCTCQIQPVFIKEKEMSKKCNHCGGSGIITQYNEAWKCTTCKGSGKV